MFKPLGLAAGLIFSAAAASAATVGFNLTISGDTNVPSFNLTNTSATAALSSFSITIGRTDRNFDFAQSLSDPLGGSSTLVTGDTFNNLQRVDQLDFSFTGFDSGEFVTWEADVDRDSVDSIIDYRDTLFNNGAAPNSVVTAVFDDSSRISFTLPDDLTTPLRSYSFRVVQDISAVPLPAGGLLMLGGLGALTLLRRRKARG